MAKQKATKQSYIIDKNMLHQLIKNSLILAALENGGVDNWEWYGDSLNDFLKQANAQEFEELIVNELAHMNVGIVNVDINAMLNNSKKLH